MPAVIIISVESTADTLIIIEVTHYFNDDMDAMCWANVRKWRDLHADMCVDVIEKNCLLLFDLHWWRFVMISCCGNCVEYFSIIWCYFEFFL